MWHLWFGCPTTLACEQVLRGALPEGRENVSGILISASQKSMRKCWLAEMTLVMTSLPLARVFQCSFTFALVSASCWLAEIWQLIRRGATGELEVRRSCKLSFLFPPRRQSALESMLAGYTTLKTLAVQKMDIAILLLINRDLDKKQKWYQIPATPQKKQQLG